MFPFRKKAKCSRASLHHISTSSHVDDSAAVASLTAYILLVRSPIAFRLYNVCLLWFILVLCLLRSGWRKPFRESALSAAAFLLEHSSLCPCESLINLQLGFSYWIDQWVFHFLFLFHFHFGSFSFSYSLFYFCVGEETTGKKGKSDWGIQFEWRWRWGSSAQLWRWTNWSAIDSGAICVCLQVKWLESLSSAFPVAF